MDKADGISLQVNISPSDLSLCKQLLPFQIKLFYDGVDEIVLTIESKKSKGTRFGKNFEENKLKLYEFLKTLIDQYPKIRVIPVDYSLATKKLVSEVFFLNTTKIPDKDFRGGPFYCYFFGLYSCRYKKIMHLDCDMIFGGDAIQWLKGAVKLLQDPAVYCVLPLSGPPTSDFAIKQPYVSRVNRYTYSFDHFTTRVFLTDYYKFISNKLFLRFINFNLKKGYRALRQNNFWEMPELLVADTLRKNNLLRLDYWGENDTQGFFSLHPLTKPNIFISFVPELLKLIQKNNIPEEQKGYYDLKDEVFYQS